MTDSRRKGRRYEREVASWLVRIGMTGVDDTPALLERGRSSAQNGIDVIAVLPDGRRLDIQTKVGARPNPWRAVSEVESVSGLGVAVCKRNRGKGRPVQTIVAMSPDVFERLLWNR